MVATADLANWLSLAARFEPARLTPGERGRLVVEVRVPDGCHVESHRPSEPFLIPTELFVGEVDGVRVEEVEYPPDEERVLDWSPAVLRVYRGSFELAASVEVSAGAAPGSRSISGRVRYQGCTEAHCLMPAEQSVEATLDIV